MNTLSTHILNTTTGLPAAGVRLILERPEPDNSWRSVADYTTDADGRVKGIGSGVDPLTPGMYRLTFHTEEYFIAQGTPCFHPRISIVFKMEGPDRHYHVPLLLSPYGYTTYRGS